MSTLYDKGFIQRDTLQWGASDGCLCLCGEIACLGNIRIKVRKQYKPSISPAGEDVVETVDYAYTASVSGYGNIFRYDANHGREGHPDNHHRHDFDWRTGDEVADSPRWIGFAKWPTLAEFIDEVHAWYDRHRDKLPEPNAVAIPLEPTEDGYMRDFIPVNLSHGIDRALANTP